MISEYPLLCYTIFFNPDIFNGKRQLPEGGYNISHCSWYNTFLCLLGGLCRLASNDLFVGDDKSAGRLGWILSKYLLSAFVPTL